MEGRGTPRGLLRIAATCGLVAGIALGVGIPSQVAASHCPSGTIDGNDGENYLESPPDQATLIRGMGAADWIRGYDCNDELRGGTGPDNIHGAYGYDRIYGNEGNDRPSYCSLLANFCGELVGGGDLDDTHGGANSDFLDERTAGNDSDIANGDDGDDDIYVNDGDTLDGANGGLGSDLCRADSSGEKSACEL